MKTIQIPLELAEELLMDTKCNAYIMYDEWNSGKGSHEEYLPDSYHKLKKLVEDKHTFEQWQESDRMIDKMEKQIKHPELTLDEALKKQDELIEESKERVEYFADHMKSRYRLSGGR